MDLQAILDTLLQPAYLLILPVMLVPMLFAAVLQWWERRVLGFWQDRLGPNRTGWFGVLQIIADVLKLLTKHDWIPPFADKVVFALAPAAAGLALLMAYAAIPWSPPSEGWPTGWQVADLNIGVLYFMAMTSLGVYSILMAGMASNNKYALLGSLRGAAQLVSYEVFMGLSLMGVVMLTGSFSLKDIVAAQEDLWFVVPQFLGFLVFLIAAVCESHRAPFDLPEAEQELTGGFHTEFSGMKWAFFMLSEYLALTLNSLMIVVLFFGGGSGPEFLPPIIWLFVKTAVFIHFIILLRVAVPRPRYDHLMVFGWKYLLPLTLANVLVTGAVMLSGSTAGMGG